MRSETKVLMAFAALLLGLIFFRSLLLWVGGIGLAIWLVSRMFVWVPEKTAKKVGSRVYINYPDHGLDAHGNVVPRPGARHEALQWIGPDGITASRQKSRLAFWTEDNKGNYNVKTSVIPLEWTTVQVGVSAKTADGKACRSLFKARVRVTNPMEVGDWVGALYDQIWAQAKVAIGRRTEESVRRQPKEICQFIKSNIRLQHMEMEELLWIH